MAAKKFAGVRWTAPFSIPAALSTPLSLASMLVVVIFFILIRTFTIAINSLHPSQNIELVFRLFRFYSSLYLSVILLGSNSRRQFIVQYFVVHLVYLPCFYFVFTGSCGSWSRSHLANTIAAMIHCVPKLDLYCAPLPKNSASPISIMTLHCCVWTIVCRSPISFDRFVCQPMRVRVVDPSLFFVWDDFFRLYFFRFVFSCVDRWSVCENQGHCHRLGHPEGRWQTIVFAARSRSTRFGQWNMHQRHQLHTENDHRQYDVCRISGRRQEGLLSGEHWATHQFHTNYE